MKRTLPPQIHQKVKVYRNLVHNCLSVMKGGKVIGHARFVVLEDVQLQVSEKGRKRCLRRGRKTVHAYCVGKLIEARSDDMSIPNNAVRVSYNPYKAGYFYEVETGNRASEAEKAIVCTDGVFVFLCEGT